MSSYMLGDVDAKVGVYFMSNSGAPLSIGDAALALLRGEEYVPPPARKTIAVDPRTLDRYVGVFDIGSDVSITVAREGDGIVFRTNDQATGTPLLAETATRFFAKGSPYTITFVPNPAGSVNEFVVEAGDDKQVAKRRK
jgi:hypothetical protein